MHTRAGLPHSSFVIRHSLFFIALTCFSTFHLRLSTALADTFTDDFTAGINSTCWEVVSNQPLYSVDATQGAVRFSKPAGGDYSLQNISLASGLTVQGNFDMRVDFRDASITRLDGNPGNQVQLNTSLGSQVFCVVRSDETAGGHNVHVWAGGWFGPRAWANLSGTMRIVRTGAHVQAFIDSTLIYEANYSTNDTSFSMTLQNNGTRDATAVTFDNFYLTADRIVPATPQITSPTRATATADWYFSYQITATRNPISYGATGLPPGLDLNPTNGLLTGAVSDAGEFVVSLHATNTFGVGGTNLTLTVEPNPAVQWPVVQGGNDHWFRRMLIGPAGINWSNAAGAATARGGHLATLTSAAENAFVYSLITNAGFWFVDGAGNTEGPWLGGLQPAGSLEPAATGSGSRANRWHTTTGLSASRITGTATTASCSLATARS